MLQARSDDRAHLLVQGDKGRTNPRCRIVVFFIIGLTAVCAIVSLIAAVRGLTPVSGAPPTLAADNRVVLISLDGFRWDYLDIHAVHAPNLRAMRDEGASVTQGLLTAFTSKTFPDHYALITGLWEESSGLVGNTMYDPVWDEHFSQRTSAELGGKWWEGGEPLWVTAEKQGVTAATYFWPGSDVGPIHDTQPTYWKLYDGDVPFRERTEEVLSWLADEASPAPRFITLYMEQPDSAGHQYGPLSAEVGAAIELVDAEIGHLRAGIAALGMTDKVDIVVTADHGMAETAPERSIDLRQVPGLDDSDYWFVEISPILTLYPQPFDDTEKLEEVYNALQHVEHLTVYHREDLPEELHYKNHRRIPPLVAIADEGWTIRRGGPGACCGAHGYDNALASMRPFFLASGPSFQPGASIAEAQSVDVYPLLCSLLDLEAAPNNGTDRLMQLLRN